MKHIHSDYLRLVSVSKSRDKIVKNITRLLKNVPFDTVAFCGMSGALVAPIVASRMKRELLGIRKDNDSSHAYTNIEGYTGNYVIIDDLVSRGDTLRFIKERIKKYDGDAKCLAVVLYNLSEDRFVLHDDYVVTTVKEIFGGSTKLICAKPRRL